jgi:hypothetical protein
MHAGQLLAREAAAHVPVGAHAQEYRIVLGQQRLERQVASNVHAETKLDAHTLHQLAARLDHLLLQLERWYAEGQQAADALMAVEHHRLDAIAHQDIGAAQSRRPRADDRDALVGGLHARHVGPPALPECLVGDVLLDRSDGHRAQAVVERAGALAQPVLRADATAYFRQRVGAM